MFFNRLKSGFKQGLDLGRDVIRRAPGFISSVLQTGNKFADTAKKIESKAQQASKVYDTINKTVPVNPKVDAAVRQGFDVVSRGVKKIDEGNQALQNVGGAVSTLF